MTKRQREQVVELLRCAADRKYGIRTTGSWLRLHGYEVSGRVEDIALDAWWDIDHVGLDAYRGSLLEAAARVEEGSWP